MYQFRLLIIISFLIGMKSHAQLLNGNFESGRNAGWAESSQGNFTLIAPAQNFASTSISPAVNAHLSPGDYKANWNASHCSSGIYFCRMTTDNQTITRKIILSK